MNPISAGPAQGFLISKVISTQCDGIDVEGHVYGNSYDITVEIIKPYRNLTAGLHIMMQLRGHQSFDGNYGELRATALLHRLYNLGEYLSRKLPMLKTKLEEHRQQVINVSEGRFTQDEFRRRRRVLRKMLRRGDVTNIQYQRWIAQMREDVDGCERRIWKLEDQFFKAYFPMEVPSSIRQSVIDMLDGRNLLKPTD